ncbi:MAG TPA: histidine phosphatase family protein [Opitutaceae bacterium]|jgi:probable phosphoglycerate mutase
MVAQIYVIRHGETEWSANGRHTGSTDLPLNEAGESRARRLRAKLQGIPFSHVLTSPLQRARRTCHLAGLGERARTQDDLHEWNYGEYEGRTTAEIHAGRPDWNLFRDGCPLGESVEQVSKRADAALAAIQSLDGIVAVFSHGHFLRVFTARWIGLPAKEGEHLILGTASRSILGYEHSQSDVPAITLLNAGLDV